MCSRPDLLHWGLISNVSHFLIWLWATAAAWPAQSVSTVQCVFVNSQLWSGPCQFASAVWVWASCLRWGSQQASARCYCQHYSFLSPAVTLCWLVTTCVIVSQWDSGTPPPWLNTIDADKINRAGGGRLLPGCLVWAHPRHISLGSGWGRRNLFYIAVMWWWGDGGYQIQRNYQTIIDALNR